jgi:hypothetical protein
VLQDIFAGGNNVNGADLAVTAMAEGPGFSVISAYSATQMRGSGLISFGNFVFLGLRSNSGMRQKSDVDLYL